MMGRLRPGVNREHAQAALRAPFEQWVTTTATNDASAPIFQSSGSRKGQADSIASAASTRSRCTCC